MQRLTFEDESGNWGLLNYDIKKVPRELYGAMCKLKDYEESLLTPKEVLEVKEARTPVLPDYEGDGCDEDGNIIYDTWICPKCRTKYEVDYEKHKFCPECGQAIRWEG